MFYGSDDEIIMHEHTFHIDELRLVKKGILSIIWILLASCICTYGCSPVTFEDDKDKLVEIALEHKNWETRKEAVDKLKDQKSLIKVALKCRDSYIRKAAVEKLEDDDLLVRLADDRDNVVRAAAVNHIGDQLRLTEIVLHGKYDYAREAALEKIHDRELLFKIAVECNNPRLCELSKKSLPKSSIDNISRQINFWWSDGVEVTDQIPSAKQAIAAIDPNIRKNAATRITDKKLLEKILWRSAYIHRDIAAIALCGVDDDAVLKYYSKRDGPAAQLSIVKLALMHPLLSPGVVSVKSGIDSQSYRSASNRLMPTVKIMAEWWEVDVTACGGKITNKNIFKHNFPVKFESKGLPSSNHIVEIRIEPEKILFEVLSKAKLSQHELSKIAINGSASIEFRSAAILLLTDQKTLNEITADNRFPYLQRRAAKNLKNQEALYGLALNGSLEALKSITDNKLLEKIARKSNNTLIKIKAVDKITDQNILTDLALRSKDSTLYTGAIRKLTNQEALTTLVLRGVLSVQNSALRGLTDQQSLAKVVLETKNPDIKYSALGKIRDKNILGKLALMSDDMVVRLTCVELTNDVELLKKLVKNDKNQEIRKAAEIRLSVL